MIETGRQHGDRAASAMTEAPVPPALPVVAREPMLRTQPSREQVSALCRCRGRKTEPLRRPAAQVLAARGFTAETAADFLNRRLSALPAPSALKGWDTLVARLERAVRARERVALVGDFDVDGLCAASLFTLLLSRLSGPEHVRTYIPNRLTHGYGLHRELVERAHRDGCTLLVALDLGSTNIAELDQARRLGMETAVIDHHHLTGGGVEGIANFLVNPHQAGCGFAAHRMCAGGLSWYVAAGLIRRFTPKGSAGSESEVRELLDLAALATVCDVVPLRGPNRILAFQGGNELGRRARPGIAELVALLRSRGLIGDQIGAREIGFLIGPCINAAGRLGDATPVIEFLTTTDSARAKQLAEWLLERNGERQRLERSVVSAAERTLAQLPELPHGVVVWGEGLHIGVVGLGAQRIADRLARPTAVIGMDPQGRWRGSVRAGVEGVSVVEALERCSQFLVKWGGHTAAGGFSIEADQREPFRAAFDAEIRRQCRGSLPAPRVNADLPARSLADLLPRALQAWEALAPFGAGNPRPIHWTPGLLITDLRQRGGAGGESSLELYLHDGRRELRVTWWRCGAAHGLAKGMFVTAALSAEQRMRNGRAQHEITLRGIREARLDEIAPKLRHNRDALVKLDDLRQADLLDAPVTPAVPLREPRALLARAGDPSPSEPRLEQGQLQLESTGAVEPKASEPYTPFLDSIAELCQHFQLRLVKSDKIQSRAHQLKAWCRYFESEQHFHYTAATGAGKTLFALVALSRDIGRGDRVFFLTPRDTLIAQAREEALRFLSLAPEQIAALDGTVSPDVRPDVYHDLNIKLIFSTPEVIKNDLEAGRLSMKFFSRVVFDEVHLMRGEYAYRAISRVLDSEQVPRLSLSATPGGSTDRLKELELALHVDNFRALGARARPRREERFSLTLSQDTLVALRDLAEVMQGFACELFDRLRPLEWWHRQLGRICALPKGPFRAPTSDAMRGFVAALRRLPDTRENREIRSTALALDHLALLHEALSIFGREFFLSRAAARLWDIGAGGRTPQFLRRAYGEQKVLDVYERLSRGTSYHHFAPPREYGIEWAPPPAELTKAEFLCKATEEMVRMKYCDHPKERMVWDLLEAHLSLEPQARAIVFSRYAHVAFFLARRINHFFERSGMRQKAVWVVGKGSAPAAESVERLRQFHAGDAQVLVGSPAINFGLNVPEVPLAIFYDHSTSPEEREQREGRVGRGRIRGTVYTMTTEGTSEEISYLVGKRKLSTMRALLQPV